MYTAICALIIGSSGSLRAGDWTLTRGVGLLEVYTDNISLTEESPESEFITQLSPNVRLSGEGRRVQLDFAYTLRAIHYASNSDEDDIRHNLRAASTLELYEDLLFL
ncbi:MAG: TIGR03016 family PEP-CTERM system-associated outer membrane protein, partial [Chromatiales bacterium]